MGKYFLIILYITTFLILCSCRLQDNSENQILKLQFNNVSADKIDYIDPFVYPARPKIDNQFIEKIEKYPKDFKILSTYQFEMQPIELSKLFFSDSVFRSIEQEYYSQNQIDFMFNLSNLLPFDYIISACEVEDESSNKYFIFDSNNDEDLSNDSIISYTNFENQFISHNNSSYQIGNSSVKVDIYNGEKISTKNLLLSFVKKKTNDREICFISNRNINLGYIVINDLKYLAIITNPNLEVNFNRYSYLWIDLNNNSKFDKNSDFYQQMIYPFTLLGSSYQVNEIDIFGNYLYLERLNSVKYPPIEVGLFAPDFNFNDSGDSKLSNYKEGFILLDFWSCNPFSCNSRSFDLYNKFRYKKNFQLISCALDSNTFDLIEKNYKMDNEDDRIIIPRNKIAKIRKLYQQTSIGNLILINPEFKIISIEKFSNKQTEKLLLDL